MPRACPDQIRNPWSERSSGWVGPEALHELHKETEVPCRLTGLIGSVVSPFLFPFSLLPAIYYSRKFWDASRKWPGWMVFTGRNDIFIELQSRAGWLINFGLEPLRRWLSVIVTVCFRVHLCLAPWRGYIGWWFSHSSFLACAPSIHFLASRQFRLFHFW